MKLLGRIQRLLWGRTREESRDLAEREAYAREWRAALAQAKEFGRCLVVHAPEINGGYCEVHQYPVERGNTCEMGTRPLTMRLKKEPPQWTITRLSADDDFR